MYNVIVVDDEKIIRNGMKNYINRHSVDFRVIEDFADGKDAEEYLKSVLEMNAEDVSVVITDIRMTDMSGLELSQWIYENMKSVIVVILSGYKEFDYAKEAMSYGVKRYLLKPADTNELMQLLNELKTELDARQNERQMSLSNIKHLYSLIAENKLYEASLYFGNILNEIKYEPLDRVKESTAELFGVIVNKLNIYYEIQVSAESLGLNSILNLDSVPEIQKFGIKIIETLSAKMSLKSEKSDEHILREAKHFIEENYMKDISLQDLSDKMFFSPSYFSRFFKKYTGEKFSDYLLRVRMTKAVELLKKGNKAEDVSKRCGYNSAAYFSHIFKEYYGYTPKDYVRRF